MQYRKKPIVVDAIQWTGNNELEVMGFVGRQLTVNKPPSGMEHDREIPDAWYNIVIPTLEGNMTAIRGDMVIRGVKGEYYPCKLDVFGQTYEIVENNP